MSQWMLIVLTLAELGLLVVVVMFYVRLRRSESLLKLLQQRHEDLMSKIHFNSELEQELVTSFEQRQHELATLNDELSRRAEELEELLARVERVVRKPESQRQTILDGRRRGVSVQSLAQSTGLTADEIELVLLDAKRH